MKSFTKFFLTFALLMSAVFTYAQSYQNMTPQEVAFHKALEQQKTAALGPVTTAQSGDRTVTNDCSTAFSYGNINDPAVTGSIASYGEEWYSFTGADNMTVTVSLCNSDYDTKLEVWNDCGDANYAYYNDDACGTRSEIGGIPFTAGDVMYVKVYGYSSSSGNYELEITGTLPPPAATPIATFPFTIDFENGDFPAEIMADAGGDADMSVTADAANASSYGALLEGVSYSGWHSPYSTGEDAFNSSPTHIAAMNMAVQPNGSGLLFMNFDMRQNYSYNANYAWFRVTVNGTPVPDVDGNTYFQPATADGDPFVSYTYNLSAYQGADFDIAIEAVNKYAYLYYQGGDAAMVDNINFEFIPVGTIEGHVTADGAPVENAHVGIVDLNEVLTDADGYYSYPNILSGDYDMYAFKDGMNQVAASVTLTAGQTLTQDFNLSSPIMIVSPLSFTNTLNPEEYLVDNEGIQNAGNGALSWTASIEYPTTNAVRVSTMHSAPNMNATYPAAEGGVLSATPGTPSGARADCPEGTIWGNPAVNYDNAYTSDDGAGYQCYQSYSTSEDIGSLTFYFVGIPAVPTTADFNIEFYQAGSTPGAQVVAYTVSVDAVNTGEMLLGSYPIYSFTVNLPDAVTEHDGWVSVHAPASGNTFYWVNTTTGSGVAMQNAGVISGYQLDVCLGGASSGAGDWLSLSKYEGSLPANGGSETIDVNFDAAGTQAGEVYTANIVYVANPNVSQTVVPATMIIAGDPLLPVGDFEATLVNEVTGQVDMTWTYPPTMDPTFQYFLIRRDGMPIANTTDTHYTDMLPGFGTYNYTVAAVYAEGETTPAGPVEVVWLIPALCNNPASVYNEQWPDVQENVTLTLENCGDGTLAFSFPDYINTSRFSCTMQVGLNDSYGDGWNGGALDVLVNGVVVLDHITLTSGHGPEYHPFDVEGGDNISAVYYPGSWSSENSYDFLDEDGNIVYHSANVSTPEGIVFGSCAAPSYIIAVNPAQGQIASGETLDVTLTYSSAGFPVGDFDEYLHINSNDPNRMNDSILNTMHVYTPATLYGTVTDCNSGAGMGGVDVTATGTTTYMTSTNEDGYYEMNVDEDTYDIDFDKVGFVSQTVAGVFAPEGAMTETNASLCEAPYPVGWVYADPNQDDTQCLITWNIPMGPYEISYDDGTANDFVTWSAPGNSVAVKFTPAGYPATVTGGRMFVGDGSFPDGANFMGSQFAIGVLDDDGANGMPGTVLDSIVVDVNNYGWVVFEGMNANLADGDFYLVMWQTTFAPNAAPIGIDNDLPTAYRSYVKYGANDWMASPYQDFMMRAVVSGPNAGVTMNANSTGNMVYPSKIGSFTGFVATNLPKGIAGVEKAGTYAPVASESNNRDLTNYTVAIVDGFDPDAGQTPEANGTVTPIANTANLSYNHTGWNGEPQGWYAYAVRANYESNQSDFVFSNIVGHLMDAAVTVNTQLCDGAESSDVEVRLVGHNYPYNSYFGVTDATGTVVFDSVIKGNYDIYAEKVGFQDYEHLNRNIMGDYTENIMLQKKAYPVRNLTVDALTSNATWDTPLIIQMDNEGFEGTTFPPEGWQSFTQGVGWFRSDNGGSSAFAVPAGDGFYAISNDDAAGSVSDGSMDYLITPELDLRESDNFNLYFDSYFDGSYGQMGYVEYSLDDGATWEGPLYTASPVTDWTPETVDLSSLSGMGGARAVRLAFHADDGGAWASGWAIDNVAVHNGAPQVEAYDVFLDDAFVIEVPGDQLSYAFENLTYGTTYTAAVQAKYGTFCELSPKVYYTWTSSFLYPPRNISDAYIYGTNEVPVTWNPPMTDDGIPMASAESTVVYDGPQTMVANADQASNVTRIEYAQQNSSRATWDLQFAWPTFYNDGEAGVECDGNFIYTAQWSGNRFTKYTLDGTWVEDFTIPGVSGVRDLAYDGTYFYGAAASTSVYQMDFENHALISTINAPTAVRAIAYNDDSQTFYGDNWSTDITEFDMTGAFVSSFAAGGYSGIYGMAYDKWSDGGPYLWIYDQGANNIVQIALPDGTFTGVTVDVASIAGTSSSAGGLFTQPGIVEGTVTIGGNSQNEMIWGLELAPYSGGGGGGTAGVVPDGLLSFNVYRDGDVIGTKDYNGEAVDDDIVYVDNNLMPGTYLYEVSAVYDLTSFGFPGETGESALDGVDTVTVIWGMDMPFTEDWATGTFDFNNWTTDAPNWKINSQVGDDQPSAEFSWDPLLENDYSASLTSAPLKADMLSQGDIWLDYNIKLDDRNATGEEHLKVEVYDGDSWTQVAEVANNGSFGFADGFNHINISDYAMGKVFQVRFNATGLNSFDLVSWFVDNVNVYRTCAAPTDLTGEYVWYNNPDNENDWGAMIGWEAPYIPQPISAWIHWDDGTNFSAIGLTDGGDFSVAARWDAGQLSDYDGTFITKLQYFPATTDFSNIIVKIWTGANASNLIYENDVTASAVGGMWNEVDLATPIALDVNDELWIGYTLLGQVANTFPAGTDAGPAIAGYGDKITTDGVTWDNLSDFGLSYNWNVQAFVEELTTNAAPVAPIIDNTVYSTANATLSQGAVVENGAQARTATDRSFTGFKLYRSETGAEGSYVEYASIPYEDGVTSYSYYDQAPNVEAGGEYWYKVSSMWEGENDVCESAFAASMVNPMYDYVDVFVTSVDNPLAGVTNVYPNPARDNVTVTTTEGMNKLTVINYVGQVVYQKALNGESSVNLNTGNYDAGVYVIRIETASGTTNKRVVITK